MKHFDSCTDMRCSRKMSCMLHKQTKESGHSSRDKAYLSITNVLIHCFQPVESVVHLNEVCLQQHLNLLHVGIVIILAHPSVRLALQAQPAQCKTQRWGLLQVRHLVIGIKRLARNVLQVLLPANTTSSGVRVMSCWYEMQCLAIWHEVLCLTHCQTGSCSPSSLTVA